MSRHNKDQGRQQTGELTSLERIERDESAILKEINSNNDIKKVMSTREGRALVIWLLKRTKILADPFTNSGMTAYNLGQQNIGKVLLKRVTEAGCKIEVSELSDQLNIDHLDQLHEEYNKLQEEKQCQKTQPQP